MKGTTIIDEKLHMKNNAMSHGTLVLVIKFMRKKKEKQTCPLCNKTLHLYHHLRNKHKLTPMEVRDILKNLKDEEHKEDYIKVES